MRQVRRSALVGVSRETMFDIVNDVASYPRFVPWCCKAEVRSQTGSEVIATLHIRKGLLRTHFTTRNTLRPPEAIELSLVEGSFRKFAGQWRFDAISDADGNSLGCRVTLELQFELAGALGGALLEGVFEHAASALVDAFVARARALPTETSPTFSRSAGS